MPEGDIAALSITRSGSERGLRSARHWGRIWEKRAAERLGRFFPKDPTGLVHAYIVARTVPCPSTRPAMPWTAPGFAEAPTLERMEP
jgi:hypothetical protein